MKEHASDCALRNAPAELPGPCSCGVSPRFMRWQYEVPEDFFGFRQHSRETLIQATAIPALVLLYRGSLRDNLQLPNALLVGRALSGGLVRVEIVAALGAWGAVAGEADDAGSDWKRRRLPGPIVSEDLAPLPADVLTSILAPPTADEIVAALTPWCDYHIARWEKVTTPVPE